MLGGVAGALVLERRADSVRALKEVLARHEAMGIGTRAEDIRQYCPPVNTATQDRLYSWMRLEKREFRMLSVSERELDLWVCGHAPAPLEKLRSDLAYSEPVMAEFTELLEDPLLCLTSLGFAVQDLPRRNAGMVDSYSVRFPNLLATRWVTQHFGRQALISQDPDRDLAVIDRLCEKLQPTGTLIDAMIAIACENMRDRAHLRTALLGRSGHAGEEAWLDERSQAMRRLADGFRGERLFVCAMAREMLAGTFPPDGEEASWLGDRAQGLIDAAQWSMRIWLTGPRDCAALIDFYAKYEAALRGEPHTEALLESVRRLEETAGPLVRIMLPNHESALGWTLICESQGRAARLFALLARLRNETGRLPAAEIEFQNWLGDRAVLFRAEPLRLGLRYERLEEHVARIAVDPGLALTPLVADAIDLSESPYGKPRKDTPLDWADLGVTIDFSKIPVRR